jgi:LuxR family maltose regulon positive regulatory protein
MVDALVRSKALVPQLRRALVPRPRLSDQLNRPDVALVLVSAPPGFGKTTLLASALGDLPAGAWVSLDARDADPVRFWSYTLLALDGAVPGVGIAALNLLDSAAAPVEEVVAALVNELSVRTEEVTLVLDDYHLADSPAVASSVTFLLEHRPPQLHLVISTRADPSLPLPRLRARGELVELRAHDLRFSLEESASYLNQVHDLGLSPSEVESLESRTEGWAAALQLAALSLHGREDTAAFIGSFAGDSSWTTWSTRCWTVSHRSGAASCSRPRCSTGCPARCAMP